MAIFNCYIKLPAGKPLSSCTLGTSSAPSLGSRSPAFSSSPAKAGKCSSEARREQKRAPREEPGARIGDLRCLIRWLGIVPWRLWKVKDEVWNQILGDLFPWQVMKDDEFWHWILEWHFDILDIVDPILKEVCIILGVFGMGQMTYPLNLDGFMLSMTDLVEHGIPCWPIP